MSEDTGFASNYKQLTVIIAEEILNPSVDQTFDYQSTDLDTLIFDEKLRNSILVERLLKIGNIGINIHDRLFIKNMLIFSKELKNLPSIASDENEFYSEFEHHSSFRNVVVDHIIININSYLDVEKAKIYARLFKALVCAKIDWEYFKHLTACLIFLNLHSIPLLERLAQLEFNTTDLSEESRDYEKEALLVAGGIAYTTNPWSSDFFLSETGKDLYVFGIKQNEL